MRNIIASIKFLAFALLCLIIVPAQSIMLLFHRGKYAYILPWLWQKGVCAIFRITLAVSGAPYTKSQTLYVSNHLSYLDIPAIGSVLRASFIAKKDVSRWPVFGFLSTLQQTAFVSRNPSDARTEKNALDNMLAEGKSLIVFPEGTSTDGTEFVPFKSSLFAIAFHENAPDLMIQPFTLQMQSVNGHAPETQELRDLYSWHRHMDTELHEHLWRFAQSKGAVIAMEFHDPIRARDYEDRKILAKTCQDHVFRTLEKQAA